MRRTPATFVALGIGLVLGAAPGCVGYHSSPHAEGSLTRANPNTRAVRSAMREALRWTIQSDPDAPAHFAINLPSGVTSETYWRVAASVGGEALSADNLDLPRYSVGRVWVRGGEAKVDVTRPLMILGPAPDGSYATQTTTIEMVGGFGPWHVERTRPWAVGAIDEPVANLVDEPLPEFAGEAPVDEAPAIASAPEPDQDAAPADDLPEPEPSSADASGDVIEIVPE